MKTRSEGLKPLIKNKKRRTLHLEDAKPICNSEEIPERILKGAEVKDLCRLCLSEVSQSCVEMCGTSALAREIRRLYQNVMHKEVEMSDTMPKKVCEVCTQDLKTCGEVVERFKQADAYLQDIAQSPMFADNDTGVLVASDIRCEPSAKREGCYKASYLANGDARIHRIKEETHKPQSKDSIDELSIQNSFKTKKSHSAKVTFKKEIEIIDSHSDVITNGSKAVNQNNFDSNNLSLEIPSPSIPQLNCSKYIEIISGPKSLLETATNTNNKPSATSYRCEICSTDLGNASALTAHKKKEHPNTKVRCPNPTCDIEFNSTIELDEHYKNMHGLKCSMCDRICLSISSLNRHLAKVHKVDESPRQLSIEDMVFLQSSKSSELETSRVCWICGAVLKSNIYLERHIVTMHWEKKHICVICEKGYPTELALKNHVKIHDPNHKVKRFFCQHCQKSFWSKHYLKEHLLSHTPLKPYVCETCGFGFVRKRNLVRHRHTRNMMGFCPKPKQKKSGSLLSTENSILMDTKSHVRFTSNVLQTASMKFECDVCKRKFIRKNNCDRHTKYHFCNGDPDIIKKLLEEPEIQECGICTRVLLSKIALQLHVSGHTNSTKPFQCEFCEKSFSVAYEYRTHERVHTGETPFQCSHCGKTFSKKSQLEIHESEHSDDKPFECPICQKTFKRRKLLLNHTFIHKESSRANKPFHCTHCWKGFLTKQHLTKHLRTHDEEKAADWFHCLECEKEFKLFKSLKKHIKTKHINNPSKVEEIKDYEQEDNNAFQFLQVVDNEEIVEDEQWDNYPFVVIADECVISSS